MSFLAALRVNAPEVTEEEAPQVGGATVTKAVIDTNAIVKGFRLERFAEEAVTIPEVLAEVKDRQARHTLASLPFELKIKDPDEVGERGMGRRRRRGGGAARRDVHFPSPPSDSLTHSLTHFVLRVARRKTRRLHNVTELSCLTHAVRATHGRELVEGAPHKIREG